MNVVKQRRVLCVFPAYTPSFGTFAHAYRLMRRLRAFMPPQGLLLIAAYLPESWLVRFVDENIAPADLLADYRRPFWRAAWRALRRGQIDAALGMGFTARHLIQFTREALRGKQNASFYSTREHDQLATARNVRNCCADPRKAARFFIERPPNGSMRRIWLDMDGVRL